LAVSFAHHKDWIGWTVIMLLAVMMQVVGYLSRADGYTDPDNHRSFIVQLTLLNLSPLLVAFA
jgi:hypothetical protein